MTPEGTTLYIAAFGVMAEITSPGATLDQMSVGLWLARRHAQHGVGETVLRYSTPISVITNETCTMAEQLYCNAC